MILSGIGDSLERLSLGADASGRRASVGRAELEALIEPDGSLMFSETLEDDGALVFEKACELGLEGIVSRRLGGAYWSGPCRNWLKIKNPAFKRR